MKRFALAAIAVAMLAAPAFAEWKTGPLPKDTYGWGGVVSVDQSPKTQGFHFADFRGDHVLIIGEGHPGQQLQPFKVRWYDNSLTLPPSAAQVEKWEREAKEDIKNAVVNKQALLGPLFPVPLACPCGDECDSDICTCGCKLPRDLVDEPFRLASYADTKAAGPIRTAAHRLEFRAWLARRSISGTAADRATIKALRANSEAYDEVFSSLNDEHASLAGGPVTDFFDWLLQNGDGIIALIQKVMALFNSNQAGMQAPDVRAIVHAALHHPSVEERLECLESELAHTRKQVADGFRHLRHDRHSPDHGSPPVVAPAKACHAPAAEACQGPLAGRPVLNWFAAHKPLRRLASAPFRAVKAAAGRARCRC